MNTFPLNLRLPVACFDLQYVLSTPRKPSAFEGMIVYLIDYCQKQKRFLSDTVPNVFKNVLQVNDVEIFVEPAIEELFSASINVLHTSNYNVNRAECPIRDIEITDVGQRLLREGKLPSAPHRLHQKLFYNFMTEKIETKGENLDEYDADRLGGVKPDNYENVFPEDLISQELWRRAGEKDAEVTDLEQRNDVSFKQKYSLIKIEIEDGRITCTSDDSKIRQFLDGLDADAMRDIVLSEAIVWQGSLSGQTLKLDKVQPEALYLPKDITKIEGRKVPVTLHTPGCELDNIVPEILEIVATDDEDVVFDSTHSPAKLSCNLEWTVEENGISDLSSVYEIINVRLLCKGAPLVIPMGVKMAIPSDQSIKIRQQIISVLLNNNDGLPYAWTVAGSDRALQEIVIDKLRSMADVAKGLQQLHSVKNVNITSLLERLYPIVELKDFDAVQKIYTTIKTCVFDEKEVKIYLTQLASHLDAIPSATLKDWTEKWILLKQMAAKTPGAKDLAALSAFMPIVPNDTLKNNAAIVRESLSKIGLTKNYADICKQLLATIKNKFSLEDFIFIVQALAEDTLQRKAMYCTVENYVVLPQTIDELGAFCIRCVKESIPLPDNKNIFTEQSFKSVLQTGLPDSLQKIPQFQPLQDLNLKLKAILELSKISKLEEYVSLPQTEQLNELRKACETFTNTWRKSATGFNPKVIQGCEDVLTIVEKIHGDAVNALRKIWVFDTCALKNNPDLLRSTTNNVTYIVPKIVLRELDGLKADVELREDEQRNVRAAINNIKKLQKDNKVTIEEGNISLIALEYQQNPTHDDWILSVVAAHKGSEITLVTDDNNLSNKASGEGIKYIGSEQCRKQQRETR